MNIALLTGFIDHNLNEATKITIHSLAKELKRQGHFVIIICKSRKNYKKFEKINSISVFRFNFWVYLFSMFLLKKKLDIEFDVVHSFSSAPILVLRTFFVKLFSKAKIVHTIKSESSSKLGSFKLAFLLRIADHVTTHTNYIKKKIECNGYKNVKIINSHIDTKKFKKLNTKQLTKQYKLKKPVVLYYGPFAPRKGTDALINVIPCVIEKIPDALFLFIIKKTRYFKKSVNKLKNLGLETNIKVLTGKVNLPDFINLAKVAVFPYPYLKATEATPSCVLECLACSTPVITRHVSEINAEGLYLFKNKEQLCNLIVAGIKKKKKKVIFDSSKYSSETACEQYLSVYSE